MKKNQVDRKKSKMKNSQVVIMIVLFSILLILMLTAAFLKQTFSNVKYIESDNNTINPGRGFYDPVYTYDYEEISTTRQNECSLSFVMFDLGEFKDSLISNEKLLELDNALTAARNNGVKVIFRMAYGFERESREPNDMELINSHLMQIKPILEKHSDILYVVQAGILGPWGEWHNSTFGDPPSLEARKTVIDMWLNVLDKDVFIDVRRPSFVRDMYEKEKLKKSNAYSFEGVARIGWHNDALLSTEDDYGTYIELSRKEELKWSKNHNLFTPFGGEMNKLGEYSTAENANDEFEKLRISYLNKFYNKDVLESWKKDIIEDENAFDYINKKLGYRLVLNNVWIKNKTKANRKVFLIMKISNVGYGSVYNKYNSNIIVMDDKGNKHKTALKADIRTFYPGKKSRLIIANVKIPKEMDNSKNIRLGFELEDYKDSLKYDKRYNIELSNDDIFYENGINYFAKFSLIDGKFILK